VLECHFTWETPPFGSWADARAVLDKLACIQMLDVYFPTTDGRKLRFRRYTKPEKDQALLLAQLKLHLPPQPPPEITTDHKMSLS